jgi:hypothetical protein
VRRQRGTDAAARALDRCGMEPIYVILSGIAIGMAVGIVALVVVASVCQSTNIKT